nr:erythromycin esterase family protein [uncultured Mucilaginibacter sp.]
MLKFTAFAFLPFFISVTCCFAQSPTIAWLNEHALPVDSTGKGNQVYLSALARELKNNTIIGLAEASHGTHEFSVEKTRIIKYLIEHQNYRSIGFEFGYSPMAAINNYLQTGKGDLKQLMKPLRLFKTKEILNLFETIKTYNDNQPAKDKVTLFGFDMDYFKNDIDSSAVYCKNYLEHNANLYINGRAALPVLEQIAKPGDNNLYELSDREVDALKALSDEAKAKGNSSIKNSTEFIKRLSLLYQGTQLGNPLNRDEFMADNLLEVQQASKAKTIIWGHNLHLAKDTTIAACKGMGYYVRKNYGSQYYAIGFDTFKGRVTVLDGDEFVQHTFQTEPNSFSATFANAKFPAFFVSFNNPEGNPFYNVSKNITNIYANWGDTLSLPIRPGIDFDAMIFIKETTAAVPLE